MAFLTRSFGKVLAFPEVCILGPHCTQWRWKKEPRRKPKWLPMAPSKVFRIPEHPYVPPDEKELIDELLDEYYTKVNSLRLLYKEELAQKSKDEGNTLEMRQKEEEEFRLLLEENKKENERLRIIREETLERLFEERQLELLQLEEKRKNELEATKKRVDEIVRREKEKYLTYITAETLDVYIEKALDNPVDVNFAIDLNGSVKWQGNPPPHFEEELNKQIKESLES